MGKILWLASYPKSGNTWLRAFLHNLFRNAHQPFDINRLESLTNGEAQARWYADLTDTPVEELSRGQIMSLRHRVQARLCQRTPDTVMVKTHNANLLYENQELIREDLTAGMIYIVRNPLDVCVSFADHFGLSIDKTVDVMCDPHAIFPATRSNVFEYAGSWGIHVESWTKQMTLPQLHVIRYEDMLDSPRRTFGALARFLGLSPPRERLDRAIQQSSFRVLRAQETKSGFIERSEHSARFFRVGKRDQWRRCLADGQIRRLIAGNVEQMRRFRYIPAGYEQ